MPKLPTYQSEFGGYPGVGGRRADASDFGGGVAAAQGELAKTGTKLAEAYVAHTESKEQRAALVGTTQIRAKYAQALDQAIMSGAPLDPIKEQMANELSAIGQDFQTTAGQAALDMHSSNTNLMFDEQANRIEVQRAGAEAKLQVGQFMVNQSVILRENPGYIKFAEQEAEILIDTFQSKSGKVLPPEQRALMKQDLIQNLNMTSALGYLRTDPEGGIKRLENGEWTLTAEQREHAIARGHQEIGARRAEENYAYQQEQRRLKDLDDKARDKYYVAIEEGRGDIKLRRSILDDPDLQPDTREHLIKVMGWKADEMASGPKHSNASVLADLTLRAIAPVGDPNRLVNNDPVRKALERRQLTVTDALKINNLVAQSKDENNAPFLSRLNGRIQTISAAMRSSPLYQAQPELASAIQMQMINEVTQKSVELRNAGTDPSVLLDPNSKDYYFTKDRISVVSRDVQQQAAAALPTAPDLRKDPNAWRGLNVGDPFIAPDGGRYFMTQEALDAFNKQGSGSPAAPAAPKAPIYESFIKKNPRGSSFHIDAPARSPARALQGQIFSTREEAIKALEKVYE